MLRHAIKKIAPSKVIDLLRKWDYYYRLFNFITDSPIRECPICGYKGKFRAYLSGEPQFESNCPSCQSLKRHRLFWLWFQSNRLEIKEPVLHFAPEPILESRFRRFYKDYQTADLFSGADLRLDIEKIELATQSVKTIICNHVLEHVVNDLEAMKELSRILCDDGILICSVPIIEGWDQTYENIAMKTELERELHFGQNDHLRFYGNDFRERLKEAGFSKIKEITANGSDSVQYGLQRGEKFFICSK